MNRYLVCALALTSLGTFGAARACDSAGRMIAKILTPQVGTYDEKGTFQTDISKDEIDTSKPIKECRDSPSLVMVHLRNATTAWVSLLEVKVAGKTARKCQDQAISRVADTTTPATSGIGSCDRN